MSQYDIRNLTHLASIQSGRWLITRVLGGFIYQTSNQVESSGYFVPMSPDEGQYYVVEVNDGKEAA